MRAVVAVIVIVASALASSSALAQRRAPAETVVAEMAARAPERLAVGGFAVELPEAVAAGAPLVVRLEGGTLRYAARFTVRAEDADGRHTEATASYDPAEDREPPGCDPMPGDRAPCSRVVPPPGAMAVLRGEVFARVGEVRVTVRTSERAGGAAEVTGRVRVVAPELAGALATHPYGPGLRGRAALRAGPYPGAAPIDFHRAELRVDGHDVNVDVSEPVADPSVLALWRAQRRWAVECVRLVWAGDGGVRQSSCAPDAGPNGVPFAAAVAHGESVPVERSVRVDVTPAHAELAWVSGGRIVRVRGAELGPDERAVAERYLATHPPDEEPRSGR